MAWTDEQRDRWLGALKELRAAVAAYDELPKNVMGHLEIGVPPESDAWDRLQRAEADFERIRLNG